MNRLLFKLDIHPASCLGPGVAMPHIAGTVVCAHAGARVSLYANALCMALRPGEGPEAGPRLGDEVMLGGHAGVFGTAVVGSQVTLAP
jgi:serine acetyltransferase